jgi:hypothetical protein
VQTFPAWLGVVVLAAAAPLLVDWFERFVARRAHDRAVAVVARSGLSRPTDERPPGERRAG